MVPVSVTQNPGNKFCTLCENLVNTLPDIFKKEVKEPPHHRREEQKDRRKPIIFIQ